MLVGNHTPNPDVPQLNKELPPLTGHWRLTQTRDEQDNLLADVFLVQKRKVLLGYVLIRDKRENGEDRIIEEYFAGKLENKTRVKLAGMSYRVLSGAGHHYTLDRWLGKCLGADCITGRSVDQQGNEGVFTMMRLG